MGCASGCLRVFLIVLNIIFLILALIMVVLGCLIQFGGANLWSYIDPKLTSLVGTTGGSSAVKGLSDLKDILGDYMYLIANGGLAVLSFGAFLFLVSFSGLGGACCKSKILLIVYIIILGIINICVIAVLIAFLALRPQIKQKGEEQYSNVIVNMYKGRSDPNTATNIIDAVQVNLKCCGINNYTDFAMKSKYWNRNFTYTENNVDKTVELMFPLSCCSVNSTFYPTNVNCTHTPTTENSHYQSACYQYLWQMVEKYAFYIIYVLAGCVVIMILIQVMAGVVVRSFIKDKD